MVDLPAHRTRPGSRLGRGASALLTVLLLAAVLVLQPNVAPAEADIALPPPCTYDASGILVPALCVERAGLHGPGPSHSLAPVDIYPVIVDNGDGTVTISALTSLPRELGYCVTVPPFYWFESAPCGAGPSPSPQQFAQPVSPGYRYNTGGLWRYRQGDTTRDSVDEYYWSEYGIESHFPAPGQWAFSMTRAKSSMPEDELWILELSEIDYQTVYGYLGASIGVSYAAIVHAPAQQAANQPVASFTVAPVPGAPADRQFTSTSTDPAGNPLLTTWDFGDGQTGSGDSLVHTYAKPGPYDVTMTVRNPSGNEATATKRVDIAAPALSVTVTAPPTSVPVGQELTATVDVSAGDGVGPLTGLTFAAGAGGGTTPPVLTWDTAAGIAATAVPTPSASDPFSLAPGESKRFSVSLKGSKAGPAVLRSTVGGADAAGRPVTTSGSATVAIKGYPTPTVTILAPVPTLEVGEESTVTLRVATGDGAGTLDQLTFSNASALVSDTSDVVGVLDGVTPVLPAGGLTMGPNQQRTFTVKIKGLKTGTAHLSSGVTGQTDAGDPVLADATPVAINVQDPGLKLTVTMDKDSFTIAEDKDGPKSQTRTVKVKVENTSPDTATAVSLQSFIVSWQKGLPFTRLSPNAVARIVNGPDAAVGLDLGDLAAGASVERTFDLEVVDDGHLALSSAVTWKRNESTQRAVAETSFTAKPQYLLSFGMKTDASVDDNPADPWNTPDVVEAGRSFLVTGAVKNLTNDQRIVATIPVIDRTGVSTANLLDLAAQDPAPGTPPPSTPLRDQLDPGDSTLLVGQPVAMPSPMFQGARTDVEVRWSPTGRAQLHDDEGDLVDVPRSQVLVEPDADRSVVPVVWPPAPEAMGLSEFYALYTLSFIDSTIAYWYGIGGAAGHGLDAFNKVMGEAWLAASGDPAAQEVWRQRYTGAWASFVSTLELGRSTLNALSPADKAELMADITNPLLGYLRLGKWLTTSEDTEAARQAIAAGVTKTYGDLTSLGDLPPEQLAERLGQGSGQVFGDLTFGMVTDAVMAKLLTKVRFGKNLQAAQDYVDAQAEAAAASGLKIEKGLKGIPAEAHLTDEVLAVGLGLRKVEKEQILAVAKKYNVQIMARSRGAGAVDLLEAGKARLKPFGIDAKNVSDIDVQMLGFPKDHLDTVILKKPKAWDDVIADPLYQGLGREEKAQVAARWQTRAKEWSGGGKLTESAPGSWVVEQPMPAGVGAERQKFLDAAKEGSFNLQFPTKGNWEETWSAAVGNPEGLPLGTARGDFVLDELEDGVLRPRMNAAIGGEPLPITGDVDLVAILNTDGTYPAVDKLVAAYAELAKPPLGMQHPATWSFQYEKKSMDLLMDHSIGGITQEPLAVFDPLGTITAGLFDPNLSLVPLDRFANPLVLIKVAGGTKLPSHAYGLGAVAPLVVGQQDAQNPYYLPDLWRQSANRDVTYDRQALPTQQRSLDELEQYGGGPSAVAPHANQTNGVDQADGVNQVDQANQVIDRGRWSVWTPPASGPLHIAPQTAITKPTDGSTAIVGVLGLDRLFEASGHTDQVWFRPGDQVGLALGTDQEWVGTVVAATATSITFSEAVPGGLLAGTAAHLLVAAPETTTPTVIPSPDGTGAASTDAAAATNGTGAAGTTTTSGTLPQTGSDAGRLVLLGLGAILVGLLLGWGSRRRGLAGSRSR